MLHPPLILLLAACVMCSAASLQAQTISLADSTAQALKSVRRSIERDRRASDSLRRVWDRQWRLSDSLRVESMFVRMRSDSLKRAVASAERRELELLQSLVQTDTIDPSVKGLADTTVAVNTPADSLVVASAVRSNRTARVSTGRTLSDSLTTIILRSDADTGVASYYAEAFHGRKTSSGETFNMNDRTCAHRWLPFNTRVLVTNLSNGRQVVVRVTDRGPWKSTRLIDLSKRAALDLDMIRAGTARVSIQVVEAEQIEQPTQPTR